MANFGWDALFDNLKVAYDTNSDDAITSADDIVIDEDFSATTVSPTHDDAGNLTKDADYAFVYDAWNNLVKVRAQNDADVVIGQYAYYADNRRASKTVTNRGELDGTTYFFYDGLREIEERSGSEAVTRRLQPLSRTRCGLAAVCPLWPPCTTGYHTSAMTTTALSPLDHPVRAPVYAGLRMSADEFFALADDGFKYELVDGVTIMSPSPTPSHQKAALEVAYQLMCHLKAHPQGELLHETDIELEPGLVYRPELVFLRTELVRANWRRIRTAPDLVVEVVSPESRRFDRETKKADYERHGVREYWIVDPQLEAFTFFRLADGRFAEVAAQGDAFTSAVVTGFVLDLAAVRAAFQPLL